ncbi:phosphoribosylanthranilate isomerase [Bacillus alkalicellulosilyticus]|uniref:phosphoribosylanthranilate isomerase n=1 Tax=Alkalihalobacterium alkalicellulosilyticum TaxID=1912214 RepID=UPI00099635C0|nr:phosphoribosylanthranilate isomerase [Bacillus alkalicellulosilyticus]
MGPLLKYCGNHSLSDFEQSSQSKANYIGAVFVKSKRQVTATQLKQWLSKVDWNPEQKLVGLFVNPAIEELEYVLSEINLDIIQLHGAETVKEVELIKNNLDIPLWKVIHHEDGAWQTMKEYAPYVSAFVVDSKVKGHWGGTGQTFDWNHIPNYIKEGNRLGIPVFIAGGIHPENVAQLVAYQPDGIDVSSGIEQNGQKSLEQMKRLEERIENYE